MVWTSLTRFVRCNGLTTFWRKNSVVDAMHLYLHFILKVSLFGRADGLSMSHFPFPATMWLQSGKFSKQSSMLEILTLIEGPCVALLQTSDTRLNGEDLQLFGCIYSHHFLHFMTHDFSVRGATLRFSEIRVCTIVSIRYLRKNWVSCQIHFSAR